MMICEITGSRYNNKTDDVEFDTFDVEFDVDCICDTRFEGVEACFMRGYKECMKRGLQFEKLEIIAE